MIALAEVRDRIRLGARNAKSVWNDIGFGMDADGAAGTSRSSGRRYYIPGTSLNWDSMTGDLWDCPAVQACQNWVARNFVQAPPQVVKTNADGEDAPRPNHPLTELLTNPNELYDYSTLMVGTLLSWFLNGNAYWAIERGSDKIPSELWWIPHHLIKPKKRPGSRNLLPDYYEYRSGGKMEQLRPENIVHLRYGIDPYNYLLGMSPLASVSRDVYTLHQAVNYTARMMKNSGLVGVLATPKDPAYVFDVDDFVARWQAKVTGDRQGEAIAYDVPIDLQIPAFSPEHMALETLPDRSEAVVCALYGVSASVAGLHVGRLYKTDANVMELRESAWEECVIPNQDMIAGQAGRKLLPMLSMRSRTERLTFDRSKIRPLQPDLDELHNRTRLDFQACLIDRAQWKRAVGMTPDPEDEGVYWCDIAPNAGGGFGKPAPAAPSGNGERGTGNSTGERPQEARNGKSHHEERMVAA